MVDRIVLFLVQMLSRPARRRSAPGRHSARFLTSSPSGQQHHPQVSPWTKPWNTPTREEAQRIFAAQSETTLELGIIQQRRLAVELATRGVDWPYTYEGAPFPASAWTQGAGI